ncbi:pectate lyase-like adhesive domain-containing protein, partial [Enterococcus sp. LJL99]
MSRKSNYNKLLKSNKKERYKMYKSGKHWMYATITAFTSIFGLSSHAENAQAVSNNTQPDAGKELDPGNILANKNSTQIPASTDKKEPEKISDLFEGLTPAGSEVSVDDKTNELNVTLPNALNPSNDLVRAATQYSENNNLITNFTSRSATGEIKDKVNVAVDSDTGRTDFDNGINNPSEQSTPTSVNVKVSDQITNLATYKAQAQANSTYASVSSWTELKAAYSDNTKTYIEVTGDFAAPTNVATRDLGWRQSNIIIDGGGHTLNMAGAAFNVGTTATTKGSIFTITNVDLIHWQSGTMSGDSFNGAADGVIDSRNAVGGYGYWNYNIDNVSLHGRDGASGTDAYQPRRLLDAEDSQVTLSGKINVAAKQELMQIGQVDIANNAEVTLQRTLGTTGYSMFYFMAIRGDNATDTGYAHTFTVGDGAKIQGNELSSYNGNTYPMVYYGYNGIKVGDNVEWSQDGFQMLLDLNRYSGSNASGREVTFGQNLKMTATRTVGNNSLYATNRSKVTFNAGTILDLQQWNNSSVVQTDAGSTITFISPKSLHLSRNTATGGVATGNLFSGAGTFTMNNSQISTWQGSDSKNATPAGNRNLKFAKLSVSGGTTTVTDTAGNTSTSNIIDTSTRELSTNAIDPGTIKLNYVDQYGKTIKTIQYPITSTDNYIGQYLQLRTKEYAMTNMPDNYMWAIADQLPTSAATDAQSGGDSTTTIDNGDSYGQADIAIVPMEGTEYTYNIYVYGNKNTNIQYQYKDLKTGQIVKSDYLNSEQEKAGTTLAPANYGNKIDWSSSYYTKTNVPDGYHYATSSELNGNIQPTETTVGTEAELVTLYLVADKQTVNVTFENADGTPLVNQASPISIDGYSGQEISYDDLLTGKITQSGYHTEEPNKFVFDNTDNKDSDVDKDPQNIIVKLYPDYQLAGIISNNSPLVDPANGQGYEQLPTTVTEGAYSSAGVSNGIINLPKTDNDLTRNGYIYTVKGPDGKVYDTLEAALNANNKYDTTSNGATKADSSPQAYEVVYEKDPVSESMSASDSTSLSDSTSISASTSTSTSLSDSTSISDSYSISTSTSLSDSSSLSDSKSTSSSLSTSESLSDSERNSQSSTDESTSLSTSDSLSKSFSESSSISMSESSSLSISSSDSLSDSLSISDSISESLITSDSTSVSESLSISISDSGSISTSNSDSVSDSTSLSTSYSTSGSISDSNSLSTSYSASGSISDSSSLSTSYSTSGSISDSSSLSTSYSTSGSLSDSSSLSTSYSTSGSISDSSSLSTSYSTSGSLSDSSSLSTSYSTSGSLSDSSSESASNSESLSLSVSESSSESASNSESLSISVSDSSSESASNSESLSISVSDSTSKSISGDISTSSSLSASISDSNSLSTSTSLSDSNSLSGSYSTSTSVSDSNSLSTSTSTSASVSDSNSLSTSMSVSDSNSLSTSMSVSDSNSLSTSMSVSDSNSLSTSTSVSDSNSLSGSYSASTSVSDSNSLSTSM